MKKGIVIFVVLLLLVDVKPASSWGFYGHQTIHRIAVFSLPSEMFGFYKSHLDQITEMAVNADKRRYSSEFEAPRHYLDADHYEKTWPLDTIPMYWTTAVDSFSLDTLTSYGIVPWHIQLMLNRLTQAFIEKRWNDVIPISADLGHYVSDATVPLHTTMNYNGQLTNQVGIHGLWESRLPELYAEKYNLFVGEGIYIDDPLTTTWEFFGQSFRAKDSVLNLEKQISSQFADAKYTYEVRKEINTRTYARSFCYAYHEALDGMVEKRLRLAIKMVASFWMTAWVNAGQPNLPNQLNIHPTEKQKEELLKIEMKFLSDSIKGREEPH